MKNVLTMVNTVVTFFSVKSHPVYFSDTNRSSGSFHKNCIQNKNNNMTYQPIIKWGFSGTRCAAATHTENVFNFSIIIFL